MSDHIVARQFRSRTRADGTYIRAVAQLHQLGGNDRPYFSLTGEEWKTRAAYNRHQNTGSEAGLLGCGAMGSTLVANFPELEQIERLHLADDTGAPTHDVANGWYWYSGAGHEYEAKSAYHKTPTDTPRERTARHLRIDVEQLPENLDEQQFAEFVDTLRPQWQREADAALAFLQGK